jgi:hypothetical protein
VILAAAAVLLVGLYFVGLHSPQCHPAPPTWRAFLRTSAISLSMSGLPWSPTLWPWSGLLVPALLTVTVAWLGRTWLQAPPERGRILGLVLFLGASASVALGIGWGRAGLGDFAGIAPRYGLLTLPPLIGVYLAWVCYAPSRARELLSMSLLALFCLGFAFRVESGFQQAQANLDKSIAFLRDLRAGAPAEQLAERHAGVLFPSSMKDCVAQWLTELKRAGYEPFTALQTWPTYTEESLALTPTETHDLTWSGTEGDATAADPYLVFQFDHPRNVCAVRIRYVLTKPVNDPACLEVFWRRPTDCGFSGAERHVRSAVKPGPEEQTLLIWVNDTFDHLRLDPDTQPCHFILHEVVLLEKQPAE